MAKKKEESAILVSSIDVEVSANEVITRTMGFGPYEADMVLKPISAQDRTLICESYANGNVDQVFAIVSSYSTYVEN